MRAHEIINEDFVGTIYLPNMELAVNDHAYDQADFRRVKYDLVDRIIKKVNAVAPELSKISANEKVWVYDPETNLGFGLRRIFQNKMAFQFNTVLNDRPFDSAVKVIELPSNAPDVRVTNSFAGIGQRTVRKITQGPLEPVAKKTGGGGSGGSSGGGMSGGGGLGGGGGSGGRSMSGGAGMLNPDPLAQLLR
jgi:uncharacterized membrane protein YgcG